MRLVYFSYTSYLELNIVLLIQAFLGVIPTVALMTKSNLSSSRCNCKHHQENRLLNVVMFIVEEHTLSVGALVTALYFCFRLCSRKRDFRGKSCGVNLFAAILIAFFCFSFLLSEETCCQRSLKTVPYSSCV